MRAVFYFDFISPYSYLASRLLAGPYAGIAVEPKPVVFGSILAKHGARGPGEIPERRRILTEDAILLAQLYEIPFEGPPAHPFNSIYAMRSVLAVDDAETRAALIDRYFRAAWAEGKSLEDLGVLSSCLRELGIDQDPESAATDPRMRAALKACTEEALAAGAWGVPTFVANGVLFFGHDRLPLLEAHLSGRVRRDPEKLERLLGRPQPGRIR